MSKFKVGDRVRHVRIPDDRARVVTGYNHRGQVAYDTISEVGHRNDWLAREVDLELVDTAPADVAATCSDAFTQTAPAPLKTIAAAIKAMSGAELVKLAQVWGAVPCVGSFEANLLTLADDLEKA